MDLTKAEKMLNNFPILTMDIPIECIKSIYMGERMNLQNQKDIWSRVENTNISLSLAAVANWDYAFRYDVIKFPGPLISSPLITPRTAHIFKDDPGDFGDVARWVIENHELSDFVNRKC